jgi:hypothetical protein
MVGMQVENVDKVGAQVGRCRCPQGEEMTILVERQFGQRVVVAAMGVGQEGFAAVAGPLDRPADLLAGPDQRGLFAVEIDLGAETTAHVGRHHTQLVLGDAQHEGAHQQALDVRVLVGDVERVVVVGAAVAGVGATRLHRVGRQAVVAELQRGDVRRGLEGLGHAVLVADAPQITLVVGRFVVHRGDGVERAGRIDDRRQFVVIDLDQFGCRLGLLVGFGHHHGDPIAHVAHLGVGQHRVFGLFHRRAVEVVDQPAARQATDGLEVLAGVHAQHAGRGRGGGSVDALQARMRVRRAQEIGVCLLRQRDVVGVLTAAGQKAGVFAAGNGLADETLACIHGVVLLVVRRFRPQAFIASAPWNTALTMFW